MIAWKSYRYVCDDDVCFQVGRQVYWYGPLNVDRGHTQAPADRSTQPDMERLDRVFPEITRPHNSHSNTQIYTS